MLNKYELILASASPRRSELLGYLNFPFKIYPSEAPEETDLIEPTEVVQELSRIKCHDIYNQIKSKYTNPLVIGSDTVVVYKDEILGKPKSKKEAREVLKKLSGSRHEVLTGVCVKAKDVDFKFYERTFVVFKDICDSELDIYLKSDDCMDKAGAYGIQGQAQIFIESIEGSYSNVVGFPISDFIEKLKENLKVSNLENKIKT